MTHITGSMGTNVVELRASQYREISDRYVSPHKVLQLLYPKDGVAETLMYVYLAEHSGLLQKQSTYIIFTININGSSVSLPDELRTLIHF